MNNECVCSHRAVKAEEEQVAGSQSAVGGRELRSLIRPQGGAGSDNAQLEGGSASAKGGCE